MTTKLLTNIDIFYYNFISDESKKNKTTKRSIIEKAISLYIQEQNKKKIKDSYKEMWKDEQYLNEMVENSNFLSYL